MDSLLAAQCFFSTTEGGGGESNEFWSPPVGEKGAGERGRLCCYTRRGGGGGEHTHTHTHTKLTATTSHVGIPNGAPQREGAAAGPGTKRAPL